MIVSIALSDAWYLGALSSRLHIIWTLAQGGTLEDRPRYNKSRCFDPFPFPDPPEHLKAEIRAVAEELDAFRKARQAEHPRLTLTQMYNVLEKLKAMEAARSSPSPLWGGARGGGASASLDERHADTPTSTSSPQGGGEPLALTPDEERIKEQGLVLILKELHERLDRLVFQAYGWPADLTDEEILERLVALNAERAKEEAAGHVRWLRPDYQIPRFAKGATAKTGEMDLGRNIVALDRSLPDFPKDRYEQPLAVEHLLLSAGRPMDAAELARGFRRGGKRIEERIEQVLTTLARYGHISDVGDGRYVARRAA
jgi:hypothetical protein